MKKILTIILLLIAVLVSANNYYVATPANGGSDAETGLVGHPWATIAYACSQVPAGPHTIFIGAGTFVHSTQANLALGVSIEGEDSTKTIINCTYSFSVTPSGDFQRGSIVLYSASENTSGNQSISNLCLNGGWTPASTNMTTATRGICIYRRGNVTLNAISVKGFWVNGIGFYGGYPFTKPTINASGNILKNSQIRNCGNGYQTEGGAYEGGATVELFGQDNLLIHHNILMNIDRYDHCSDLMTRFDFCTGVKIYNNSFYKPEYNGPTNLWNFAIETWNIMGGVEIHDNNFYGGYVPIDIGGGTAAGFNVKGTYDYSIMIYRNNIIRNTLSDVYNMTSEAINLEAVLHCSDIYIYDNYIHNFITALSIGSGGVGLTNFKNRIYFYNNLCISNWSGGYTLPIVSINNAQGTGSVYDSIFIVNNSFFGTSGKSQYGINVTTVGSISNLHIKNNIFYQLDNANSQGFVHMPLSFNSLTSGTRSNIKIENNLTYLTGNSNAINYTGTITGLTNINQVIQPPLFVSTSDYHLQELSPARNTGQVITFPVVGQLPYFESKPDLGRYEFGYILPIGSGKIGLTNGKVGLTNGKIGVN